jgi:hypothetical protein
MGEHAPVPLDEFLPEYDFNEIHSTRVDSDPPTAIAAARDVTAREVPMLVVLMGARRLPTVLRRGERGDVRRDFDASILDGMTRAGFVPLAERPDELVLGVVGRFWSLDGGIREVNAAEFAAFAEPGFTRAAMSFQALAVGGGTLLATETRIQATDEAARRSFGRYWRVVHPGSALIRRAWLRAIRKRAERG